MKGLWLGIVAGLCLFMHQRQALPSGLTVTASRGMCIRSSLAALINFSAIIWVPFT